jgi:hypothetical protein
LPGGATGPAKGKGCVNEKEVEGEEGQGKRERYGDAKKHKKKSLRERHRR